MSSSTLATDTAFSRAMRTTLVGSTMPAWYMSTYWLVAASKPIEPGSARMRATTTPASTAEFSAMLRVGASSARRRICTPVFSSPAHCSSSAASAGTARSRAMPPPGTMPSSMAARVAAMASSRASFLVFISASVGAPTRITPTPPASRARRSCSFSRS
ncbi:hypothetical protein D3C78_969270 [compost metagenome]